MSLPARKLRQQSGLSHWAWGHGHLPASLACILPVWLAYEGLLLMDGGRNGVDFISGGVLRLAGGTLWKYLLIHLAIALAAALWLGRRGALSALRTDALLELILESAIYAMTLGAASSLLVDRLLGLGLSSQIASALGAGIHEELLFRVVGIALLQTLLRPHIVNPRVRLVFCLAASALLFSLAHHLGSAGEPLEWRTFWFRAVAGVVFGCIYWFRSAAHAVYAHAFYDLYVLSIR